MSTCEFSLEFNFMVLIQDVYSVPAAIHLPASCRPAAKPVCQLPKLRDLGMYLAGSCQVTGSTSSRI